jgi:hypothetical protein
VAEPGFSIEKLGVVCVYHYPNMLTVVCCGIPKSRSHALDGVLAVKVVHRLAEGCGIEVPPADAPLVYGLL